MFSDLVKKQKKARKMAILVTALSASIAGLATGFVTGYSVKKTNPQSTKTNSVQKTSPQSTKTGPSSENSCVKKMESLEKQIDDLTKDNKHAYDKWIESSKLNSDYKVAYGDIQGLVEWVLSYIKENKKIDTKTIEELEKIIKDNNTLF